MVIERDLTGKKAGILEKIYGSKIDLDLTPCSKNEGVHKIDHDYWAKSNDSLCMCMNCGWTFIKSQQPRIPSGLIEVLKK